MVETKKLVQVSATIFFLIFSGGAVDYFEVYEISGSRDLCSDSQLWVQQNDSELHYCPSEDSYRLCARLSKSERTCYYMELIGEFNKLEMKRDKFTSMTSINIIDESSSMVYGNFKSSGEDLIKDGNKEYAFEDSLSFDYNEGRYYLETVDGLACDFLWDNPTNWKFSRNKLDFQQGNFLDVKCNQEYKQDGDLIHFDNWILDIDPSIISNVSADWNGTFVRTETIDEGNNVSLEGTWSVVSATFSQLKAIGSEESSPQGMFFKPDGTKMYIVGGGEEVNEYNLSIAWSVVSAVASQLKDVSSQDTVPTAVSFKSDGTKMYVAGYTGEDINEYNLSTAWSVSTAVFSQLKSAGDSPLGLSFKEDGTKMYVVGFLGLNILEYNLSTAWSVSTAVWSQNKSIASEETGPGDIFFKPDGTKMYLVGNTGNDVGEYNLSTAWSVSTAVWSQLKSVASEETAPKGLSFKTDGTKMYVTGNTDNVNEYNLSFYSSGSYLSEIFDAGSSVSWDNLSWIDTLNGETINLQVRSCDDASCSGEEFNTSVSSVSPIILNSTITPDNQYFQYNVSFLTGDTNVSPILESTTIFYSSADFSPEIFNTSLIPIPAFFNDTLNATAFCKDAENSTLDMNMTFYNNSVAFNSTFEQIANNSFVSHFVEGVMARGENWSASATCNDGINLVETHIGSVVISDFPPFFNVSLIQQNVDAGSEGNFSATCQDMDGDAITYADNISGTGDSFYTIHSPSTGLFQFRPSFYEFLNGPFNVSVSCSDGSSEVNSSFMLNITEAAGEECDLSCTIISDGCTARKVDFCTYIQPT